MMPLRSDPIPVIHCNKIDPYGCSTEENQESDTENSPSKASPKKPVPTAAKHKTSSSDSPQAKKGKLHIELRGRKRSTRKPYGFMQSCFDTK